MKKLVLRNEECLDESCNCWGREKRMDLMHLIRKEEAARFGHMEAGRGEGTWGTKNKPRVPGTCVTAWWSNQ